MRQLTQNLDPPRIRDFSKLPMRQLTEKPLNNLYKIFSKLPMRQLTSTLSMNA